MKLVINSCLSYRVALTACLKSLVSVGFDVSAHTVVVVVGGCEADVEPAAVDISRVADVGGGSATVAVARTRLQNFDYHGLHALAMYADHPLVASEAYMYVLDTVTFHQTFPASFDAVRHRLRTSADPKTILGPEPPSANICAFNAGVVAWGDMYATGLSKREAIRVELGEVVGGVRPIYAHGHRLHWPRRLRDGIVSGYVNDRLRRCTFFYPGFGLWKHVLWGLHGDLTDDVSENGDVGVATT